MGTPWTDAEDTPLLEPPGFMLVNYGRSTMAITLVLQGAFGAIVTSLINDVLMPPIGLALGHVDFKDLFVSLNGQSYPSVTAAMPATRRLAIRSAWRSGRTAACISRTFSMSARSRPMG